MTYPIRCYKTIPSIDQKRSSTVWICVYSTCKSFCCDTDTIPIVLYCVGLPGIGGKNTITIFTLLKLIYIQ